MMLKNEPDSYIDLTALSQTFCSKGEMKEKPHLSFSPFPGNPSYLCCLLFLEITPDSQLSFCLPRRT